MISPSDNDYKETKLIKKGEKELSSLFKELAQWIEKKFDVSVLNVYYDLITPGNRPRLNVILEFSLDENKFKTHPYGSYNVHKQKIIADKFKELVNDEYTSEGTLAMRLFKRNHSIKYDTNNIWVIFSSFESVAKIETNESIPQAEVQELKDKINNKDLWEISRCFSGVTFFFYTDRQVKENSENGVIQRLTEEYYNLLKVYDEFDYFKKESFSIGIDSKENFDNNYQSNWYYYYR
jgi:hypothetical protein